MPISSRPELASLCLLPSPQLQALQHCEHADEDKGRQAIDQRVHGPSDDRAPEHGIAERAPEQVRGGLARKFHVGPIAGAVSHRRDRYEGGGHEKS